LFHLAGSTKLQYIEKVYESV